MSASFFSTVKWIVPNTKNKFQEELTNTKFQQTKEEAFLNNLRHSLLIPYLWI